MTRAERLKALVPQVLRLYWRAKSHWDEHRAVVLLSALGVPWDSEVDHCTECKAMSPKDWGA